MRRILVTGGAGFIGSHVIKSLLEYENEILAFDNLFVGKQALLPLHHRKLSFVQGDIRDYPALRSVFQDFKPAWVIHLAAVHFIPYCNENPLETADVNINGTRALLKVCREFLPQKIFFASSGAVYTPQETAHQEESPVNPIDIYGMTKLVGEELVQLFHLETKVACIVGRLFNTYGPSEINAHLLPEIMTQVKYGNHANGRQEIRLGDLQPKRDFIYVSDVARAIETLSEVVKRGYEIFNIGTGRSFSVQEVINLVRQISGRTFSIQQEKSRLRKQERIHLQADISKIRRLNWEPMVSLQKGTEMLYHAL